MYSFQANGCHADCCLICCNRLLWRSNLLKRVCLCLCPAAPLHYLRSGCVSASLTFSAALSPVSSWGHCPPTALQIRPGEVTLGPGCPRLEDGCEVRSRTVPGGSSGQGVKEGFCNHRDGCVLEVLTSPANLAGQLRLLSTWPQPTFLAFPAGFLCMDRPVSPGADSGPVSPCLSLFSLAPAHAHRALLAGPGLFSSRSQPDSVLPVLQSSELTHCALIHSQVFL